MAAPDFTTTRLVEAAADDMAWPVDYVEVPGTDQALVISPGLAITASRPVAQLVAHLLNQAAWDCQETVQRVQGWDATEGWSRDMDTQPPLVYIGLEQDALVEL